MKDDGFPRSGFLTHRVAPRAMEHWVMASRRPRYCHLEWCPAPWFTQNDALRRGLYVRPRRPSFLVLADVPGQWPRSAARPCPERLPAPRGAVLRPAAGRRAARGWRGPRPSPGAREPATSAHLTSRRTLQAASNQSNASAQSPAAAATCAVNHWQWPLPMSRLGVQRLAFSLPQPAGAGHRPTGLAEGTEYSPQTRVNGYRVWATGNGQNLGGFRQGRLSFLPLASVRLQFPAERLPGCAQPSQMLPGPNSLSAPRSRIEARRVRACWAQAAQCPWCPR